jgi:arabinofuranan 3-O-arabinosyltransferase
MRLPNFPSLRWPQFASRSAAAGDPDLIRNIARLSVPIMALAWVLDAITHTGHGLADADGHPLGNDFINYWSAAFLGWHHRSAEIYNWFAFHAFQEQVTGASLDFFHYSYPPVLIVLTVPLAALPYLPALALSSREGSAPMCPLRTRSRWRVR